MKKTPIVIRISGIVILAFLMLTLVSNVIMAIGVNDNAEVSAHFSSSFMLWNDFEKMINKDFNITVYSFNSSLNFTGYYEIGIDNQKWEGNFQFYKVINFTIEKLIINNLYVKINNITLINADNIFISEGITSENIVSGDGNPLTINLRPSEWSKKEWNIFFSLIVSFIISVLFCYVTVKLGRKITGYKTIR